MSRVTLRRRQLQAEPYAKEVVNALQADWDLHAAMQRQARRAS